LGCLSLQRRPALVCCQKGDSKTAIRMHIDDGQFRVWLPVTDLRLHKADHATPDLQVVESVRRRLRGPGAVILSVGLTRGYASSTEPQPVHWLQVNNVHLESDPTWALG